MGAPFCCSSLRLAARKEQGTSPQKIEPDADLWKQSQLNTNRLTVKKRSYFSVAPKKVGSTIEEGAPKERRVSRGGRAGATTPRPRPDAGL